MSDDVVDRFRRLDTCAVSDAIDALGGGGGATGTVPRLWRSPRVCGRAMTMSVVAAPGVRAERHLGVAAIERCEPGDVIVIEQRSPLVCASWGGLLARAATRKGVAAVLVDGAARDLDEIEELALPVYARAVLPNTARRRVVEQSCGQPIVFAGIPVSPGDVVLADGSGVVVIDAAAELEVLEAAEAIARREQDMAAALDAGTPLPEVLGISYEEILDEHAS